MYCVFKCVCARVFQGSVMTVLLQCYLYNINLKLTVLLVEFLSYLLIRQTTCFPLQMPFWLKPVVLIMLRMLIKLYFRNESLNVA